MCIRDRPDIQYEYGPGDLPGYIGYGEKDANGNYYKYDVNPVSYTHLRAHETVLDLVCRLLLEKKKQQ